MSGVGLGEGTVISAPRRMTTKATIAAITTTTPVRGMKALRALMVLGKVSRNQLRHFKHGDNVFATKDLLQLVVGLNVALIDWVLQIVLLNVIPQLFDHF